MGTKADPGRREFVRRLPAVTVGLTSGLSALTLAACAGTPYVRPTPEPRGLSVPLRSLGEAGGAFLQTEAMERPIYLHRDAEDAWVAVLAACTHRGCQPEPLAGRLVCPCHGSEFALTGEVLQGPADQPLTRFPVTREGDRLVVHTQGRAP